jgi:hypothetical protein
MSNGFYRWGPITLYPSFSAYLRATDGSPFPVAQTFGPVHTPST